MARFDVYVGLAGSGYVLDVQADLVSGLNTRIVVPLMPADEAPRPADRLNPIFDLDGERLVMVTQFMASVPVSELRKRAGSLADRRDLIMNALDMLFVGF